jgi:hypothetical protein
MQRITKKATEKAIKVDEDIYDMLRASGKLGETHICNFSRISWNKSQQSPMKFTKD